MPPVFHLSPAIAVTLFVYHLWNAPKIAKPTYYPPNLLYNVTKWVAV